MNYIINENLIIAPLPYLHFVIVFSSVIAPSSGRGSYYRTFVHNVLLMPAAAAAALFGHVTHPVMTHLPVLDVLLDGGSE